MKKFILPEEIRNALLAYLLTRPMQEVENGVQLLRNLEEIKKQDEKKAV
jgi:hypothetical protein